MPAYNTLQVLTSRPQDHSHESLPLTMNMDHDSSTTATSPEISQEDHNLTSYAQTRRQKSLPPQLIIQAWRKSIAMIRSCCRPGIKQELAMWLGLTTVGTTIMISFLYLLVFIWQPRSLYAIGPHSFISEQPVKVVDGLKRWEEDFSKSVIPIMCHSHNDYWRPYPLFSALAAGCVGVEADVWLTDDGAELLVGHDRESLRPERTLKSMYLDPLLDILNHENPEASWINHTVYDRARGVFPTQPNVTLTLLIDVKTEPIKTWKLVEAQLAQLRSKQYLTRHEVVYTSPGFMEKQTMWPGPVIVVGSGRMDHDAYIEYIIQEGEIEVEGTSVLIHQEYHDYFYDAPLSILPEFNHFSQGYTSDGRFWTSSTQLFHTGSAYYASASFQQTIGSVKLGFSEEQLAKVRLQIDTAKKSGLLPRYWDLPSWPINYRDYVWDVLTREGVGILSVDDLESAAIRGWSQGYIRSVIWMISSSVWLFIVSVTAALIVYRMMAKRTAIIVARQQDPIFLE